MPIPAKDCDGEDDEGIDAKQDEGRDDGRLARHGLGIGRLLVAGDGRVPSPVDEEHVREADDEVAEVLHCEGVEPGAGRDECPTGALPLPTLTSAQIDMTVSIVSSMPSNAFWKLAEISMPT